MNNRNLSEYLSKTGPDTDCVLLVNRILRSSPHMRAPDAQFQALDVVQGLEYLHGQNVVHADLKCV